MAGMDADFAMQLLSQTLILAAEIAAPVLLATLVVGLLISIIQVVTQIQEATLTFVPRCSGDVLMSKGDDTNPQIVHELIYWSSIVCYRPGSWVWMC